MELADEIQVLSFSPAALLIVCDNVPIVGHSPHCSHMVPEDCSTSTRNPLAVHKIESTTYTASSNLERKDDSVVFDTI
jgi:hypothetical protein